MARHKNPSRTHLPRGWPQHVRSAMLHVIALGQSGFTAVTWPRTQDIAPPPPLPKELKAAFSLKTQRVSVRLFPVPRVAMAPPDPSSGPSPSARFKLKVQSLSNALLSRLSMMPPPMILAVFSLKTQSVTTMLLIP